MSLASGSLGATGMPEVTPLMLAAFVVFFLLGFLLYAALYAAIGAAVNTAQEAQSLAFPVLVPIIVAMVCWPAVMQSPDGPLAFALSMIPGMSPLMMFLRIVVLTPPAWQIVLSVALLVLGIRRGRLGGGPGLPRRHPDVRQAADVPRDRALGAAQLTGR